MYIYIYADDICIVLISVDDFILGTWKFTPPTPLISFQNHHYFPALNY